MCCQNLALSIRMLWRQVFPVLVAIHRHRHSILWALFVDFLISGMNRIAWCCRRTLLVTKEHQMSFAKWSPTLVETCAWTTLMICYHLRTASNYHHRISNLRLGLRHLFLGSPQQYQVGLKFQSKYLWQSNCIPSFCIQHNLRDLSFSSQFSQEYRFVLIEGLRSCIGTQTIYFSIDWHWNSLLTPIVDHRWISLQEHSQGSIILMSPGCLKQKLFGQSSSPLFKGWRLFSL